MAPKITFSVLVAFTISHMASRKAIMEGVFGAVLVSFPSLQQITEIINL
jgi:hypothetical protein